MSVPVQGWKRYLQSGPVKYAAQKLAVQWNHVFWASRILAVERTLYEVMQSKVEQYAGLASDPLNTHAPVFG